MTLQETIEHLRIDRDWSKRELARRSGLDQSTFTRFPADPSQSTLQALADAFGITVAQLLGEPAAAADPSGVINLFWGSIVPSPHNPRKHFDDDSIASLAESIKSEGILQNLVVRPIEDGKFEIIAGERRWRAVGFLIDAGGDVWGDKSTVPCRVTTLDDRGALLAVVVENMVREDIHPLEEAEAFADVVDAGGSTKDIAEATGRTRRWVQNRVKLSRDLHDDVKDAWAKGDVSLAQAEVFVALPTSMHQELLEDFEKYTWLSRGPADEILHHATRRWGLLAFTFTG